ncbi:Uncharacterised protein [Chlamydia trachomatis]|nr:Uncharacterised protein [Chlamydia trachomatis]
MGAQNFRSVYVPDIDEDIHDGITSMADSLGVVTRVSSIAAARTIVEANKTRITSTTPAYFDINGLVYVHDGRIFKPVNEVSMSETSYNGEDLVKVHSGQFWTMTSANLGAMPYDRSWMAVGMARGANKSNVSFLAIRAQGTVKCLASFNTGYANVSASGTIPAGTQPKIELGIFGSNGARSTARDNEIQLDYDARMNRLTVLAFPISMA